MQVHVALYGGARVVSGKSVVDLAFDAPTVTLAQMLEKLIATYPLVRPYLLDPPGMLQTSIRVLINKERPEPDATLETALYDGDLVTLLVAVAGGRHPGQSHLNFQPTCAQSTARPDTVVGDFSPIH